jgi:zinc and cadmium transporter
MLPAGGAAVASSIAAGAWVLAGFTAFFALELFLHWHHCTRAGAACRKPMAELILLGDGLHNLLGGIGVASAFLVDAKLGLMAWLAAAAHEVPQELGDFGVLVHAGWSARRALLWNLVSGLTFPAGALLAYAASTRIELGGMVLFAAGNFVYIGAADLVPEIKAPPQPRQSGLAFGCFGLGAGAMWLLAQGLGS